MHRSRDGSPDKGRRFPGQVTLIASMLRDVSDEGQARAVLSAVVQRLGTIDILANSAGLQRDGMTLFPGSATGG